MTNKDKALALINTFATGDTEAARNLLAEGYIQHNTGIADGLSGLGAALAALAEHWDVMETIAARDTWQNENGKF